MCKSIEKLKINCNNKQMYHYFQTYLYFDSILRTTQLRFRDAWADSTSTHRTLKMLKMHKQYTLIYVA